MDDPVKPDRYLRSSSARSLHGQRNTEDPGACYPCSTWLFGCWGHVRPSNRVNQHVQSVQSGSSLALLSLGIHLNISFKSDATRLREIRFHSLRSGRSTVYHIGGLASWSYGSKIHVWTRSFPCHNLWAVSPPPGSFIKHTFIYIYIYNNFKFINKIVK